MPVHGGKSVEGLLKLKQLTIVGLSGTSAPAEPKPAVGGGGERMDVTAASRPRSGLSGPSAPAEP